MGQFSSTPDDHVQIYRCGYGRFPGCGKILTEGQVARHGKCPRCGCAGFSSYYPPNKWRLFLVYLKLIWTGEAWVRKSQTRTKSVRETNSLM